MQFSSALLLTLLLSVHGADEAEVVLEQEVCMLQTGLETEGTSLKASTDAFSTDAASTNVSSIDASSIDASSTDASSTKATCMWRQTGGCSPTGTREPGNDKSCSVGIPTGHSGYCDCDGDGQKGSAEPGYDCGNTPGTCNSVCQDKSCCKCQQEIIGRNLCVSVRNVNYISNNPGYFGPTCEACKGDKTEEQIVQLMSTCKRVLRCDVCTRYEKRCEQKCPSFGRNQMKTLCNRRGMKSNRMSGGNCHVTDGGTCWYKCCTTSGASSLVDTTVSENVSMKDTGEGAIEDRRAIEEKAKEHKALDKAVVGKNDGC